jgi:hypothetical protein
MPRPLTLSLTTAAAALLVLSVACSAPTVEPTFSSIQDNVFTPSCTLSTCHDSGAAGNLDLREGQAYASIVGVNPDEADAASDGYKIVDPGNAENSYLYLQLVESLNPEYSNLMPKNGAALPQDQIDAIKDWIDDGAEDN